MRIAIGKYKGLTVEELVERDPRYAKWFWQHADMPLELTGSAGGAGGSPARPPVDQYDRLVAKHEGLKRQHAGTGSESRPSKR